MVSCDLQSFKRQILRIFSCVSSTFVCNCSNNHSFSMPIICTHQKNRSRRKTRPPTSKYFPFGRTALIRIVLLCTPSFPRKTRVEKDGNSWRAPLQFCFPAAIARGFPTAPRDVCQCDELIPLSTHAATQKRRGNSPLQISTIQSL